MKVAGEAVLSAPADRVWQALLDPSVLVRTIPGCERLESVGEHRYAMTVNAGVAAIKGSYAGTVELSDLEEPRSLVLTATGSGSPGTVNAGVHVRFDDNGDGSTRVSYDADAVVGGPVGGVGQRMLTSVAKRMAGEFFSAVDGVLTGRAPVAAAAPERQPPAPAAGQVYTAPVRERTGMVQADVIKGSIVGGALVLVGVIVGSALGRRRR